MHFTFYTEIYSSYLHVSDNIQDNTEHCITETKDNLFSHQLLFCEYSIYLPAQRLTGTFSVISDINKEIHNQPHVY